VSPRRTGRYPRTARVNELLREVLASELERVSDVDERLGLATVTGVEADPDLRHAKVFLSSMSEASSVALAEARPRLQAAIGREARLKRTPQLAFAVDPGVSEGARVDEALRRLRRPGGGTAPSRG
jgi:ribosome-binding factor A